MSLKIDFFLKVAICALCIHPLAHAGLPFPCDQPQSHTEQVQKYCAAAKLGDTASKANKTSMLFWGATAAVCSAACACALIPTCNLTNAAYIGCQAGVVASVAHDIVQAKKMRESATLKAALAGGGMIGVQLAAGLSVGPAAVTAGSGAGQLMVCATAAIALYMTYDKYQSSEKFKTVKSENLAQAQRLSDSTAPVLSGGSLTSSSSNAASSRRFDDARVQTVSEAARSADCDVLKNAGRLEEYKECAFHLDPQVASIARSREFEKGFEAATSGTLNQFLARVSENVTPHEALTMLFTAHPKSNASQVSEALSKLEADFNSPDDPIRQALKLIPTDQKQLAPMTPAVPETRTLADQGSKLAPPNTPSIDPTAVLLAAPIARPNYSGLAVVDDVIQDQTIDLFGVISQRYLSAAENEKVEELAPALPFNRYRTEQAPPTLTSR